MSRLYLGNLAHDTTEAELRAAFSRFGEVGSVKIMSDRRGRTKGFGHVEMRDDESARAAMESLRGTQFHGRTIDIVAEEASARRRGGYARSGGRRRR